ncbi:MAG TPA: alpha/beta hydrolase [Terracidiphilus sp.]|nr:alpha/beta hydrolase [Terracidiphilus sp.]
MPARDLTDGKPGPRKRRLRGLLNFDHLDWLALIFALVLLCAPLLLLSIPKFPFSLWKVAKNLWIATLAILFALVVRRIKREDLLGFLFGLIGLGASYSPAALRSYFVDANAYSTTTDWKRFLNPHSWKFWMMTTLCAASLVLVRYGNPLSIFAATHVKALKPVYFCTDRSADNLRAQTGATPDPAISSTICQGQTAVCASLIFGEANVYVQIDQHSDAPPGTEIVTRAPAEPQITYLPKDEFYRLLSRKIQESREHSAFLFVHGFRNSFQDALESAAGLAVNLKFKGVPIAFSWPADKESLTYIWRNYGGDSRRVPVGANDLAILLPELRRQSDAQIFHVIAHSIGSTLTAQAELQAAPQLCQRPKPMTNTILAAPDITPELFHQQVGAMECASDRLTIYFSHADMALLASTLLQEGRRIGAGAPPIPHADVIDATDVDTGIIGHSYLFTGSVLRDIFSLLQMPNSPATDRVGVVEDAQTGAYRLTNP